MNLRPRLAALEQATRRRRVVTIDLVLQAELAALPLEALRERREALLMGRTDDPVTAPLVERRRELLNPERAA